MGIKLMSLPPTTSKISGDSTDLITFKYRFPNFTGTHSGTIVSLSVNSVPGGGTGVASLTAYAPIFGGTTSTAAVQSGAVGSAGQVLTSNGAGTIATFQNASSGTGYVWAGYHYSTNLNNWTNTSSSYSDFSNTDSAIALTETINVNFGTVTGYGASSGASALPGIVVNPGVSGYYFVKASVGLNANTAGSQAVIRLWDGTNIIDSSPVTFNGTQTYYPTTMSGIVHITGSTTISIQGAKTGGANVLITGGLVTDNHQIEWTIFKVG